MPAFFQIRRVGSTEVMRSARARSATVRVESPRLRSRRGADGVAHGGHASAGRNWKRCRRTVYQREWLFSSAKFEKAGESSAHWQSPRRFERKHVGGPGQATVPGVPHRCWRMTVKLDRIRSSPIASRSTSRWLSSAARRCVLSPLRRVQGEGNAVPRHPRGTTDSTKLSSPLE